MKILDSMGSTNFLYESPRRLLKCIDELIAHFGADRQACLAQYQTFNKVM